MTRWAIDGADYQTSLTPSWTWSTGGGAITYKVRRPRWRAELHPRDHHGRFVETGDPLTLLGGARGTFQGVDPASGRIRVRVNGESTDRLVQRRHVTFDSDKPAAAAKPKPDAKPPAKPDVPAKPVADQPAAPAPATSFMPNEPLPPSPIISEPGQPDKAKPDMAASQRKSINELNIDDPAQMYSIIAQQGAAALRENKPMTATQAAALAAVVRARAKDESLPKTKRNSLNKGAEWLDTVVAQLRGFKPSSVPDPGKAHKIDVEQVKAGDIIALPNANGKADHREVIEAKPWYGVHKFTLKNAAGAQEERFVAPGTPIYLFHPDGGIPGAIKLQDDGKKGKEPQALYDAPPPPILDTPVPEVPGAVEAPTQSAPEPDVPLFEEPDAVQALADAIAKNNGPGAVKPQVPWYDQLALGTGSNSSPIPVTDLTIEGHTVKSGIAWRANGRSYLVELKPGETEEQAKSRAQKSVDLLEAVLKSAPPEKATLQRGMALLQAPNPHDSYWAQKYNMPGFHSEATAGFGATHIWGGVEPKPTTLAHEFGHTVDSQAFGTNKWLSEADTPVVPGQQMSWKDAGAADQKVSAFYKGRFKESAGLNPSAVYTYFKPIEVGEKGVTSYGSIDPREDFAESMRLWMKQRREGHIGTDSKTGDKIHFSDLFPERAKVLDAVMGTTTDFNTPARKQRQKEVEDAFFDNLKARADGGDVDELLPSALTNTGLPFHDVVQAQVSAHERYAKWKKDQEAAKKAAELLAKKKAAEAAAKAKAEAEVASVAKALANGKLEEADAQKFRMRVAQYKDKLRAQGYSEADVAKMAAAYETELMHEHFSLGKFARKKILPDFNTKQKDAAHSWLMQAGTNVHPQAKSQYGQKGQAVANINAELANRLNNPEDWEKYRASAYGDVGDFDSKTAEERHALLMGDVAERVGTWAATSGDDDADAVLMQEAIKQEFGLPASAPSAPNMDADTFAYHMKNRWPKDGPWYQRVARVMHDHTQEEFQKAGITHVSLYRGMGFSTYNKPAPEWAKTPGKKRVPLQPANSWSSVKATSENFAGGNHRVMLKASIPVELILGSARTGFGCLNEQEFVVFDSDGDILVEML